MSLMVRFSSVSGLRARSTMPLVTLRASFCAFRSAGFSLPTSESYPTHTFLYPCRHAVYKRPANGMVPSCSTAICTYNVQRSPG